METARKLWRNRKERKEWTRRLQSEDPGLQVIHPHAAGVDVGNSAHYVAVRPEGFATGAPIRVFYCGPVLSCAHLRGASVVAALARGQLIPQVR